MCACYECLRREGVTIPDRRDSRGMPHYPPDGRYLLKMFQSQETDPATGDQYMGTFSTGERGERVN